MYFPAFETISAEELLKERLVQELNSVQVFWLSVLQLQKLESLEHWWTSLPGGLVRCPSSPLPGLYQGLGTVSTNSSWILQYCKRSSCCLSTLASWGANRQPQNPPFFPLLLLYVCDREKEIHAASVSNVKLGRLLTSSGLQLFDSTIRLCVLFQAFVTTLSTLDCLSPHLKLWHVDRADEQLHIPLSIQAGKVALYNTRGVVCLLLSAWAGMFTYLKCQGQSQELCRVWKPCRHRYC